MYCCTLVKGGWCQPKGGGGNTHALITLFLDKRKYPTKATKGRKGLFCLRLKKETQSNMIRKEWWQEIRQVAVFYSWSGSRQRNGRGLSKFTAGPQWPTSSLESHFLTFSRSFSELQLQMETKCSPTLTFKLQWLEEWENTEFIWVKAENQLGRHYSYQEVLWWFRESLDF